MRHGRRTCLTVADINRALALKHLEPMYGYTPASGSRKPVVFEAAPMHTGGQKVYYLRDAGEGQGEGEEEVELDRVLASALPPVPLEITVTGR
jgi:hypothetical protein